jgi:methyltransferase
MNWVTLGQPYAMAVALLLFVTVQRLMELVIAKRNTAALMASGAVEHASGHYPLMVALHMAWLGGLWLFAGGLHPDPWLTSAYLLVQGLRAWTLATLGRRWTTKIIVIPGETLVARGPYRFINHPNYVVVALEILILPLAFGLVWYALLFSALNAGVLAIRIRAENEALSQAVRPS